MLLLLFFSLVPVTGAKLFTYGNQVDELTMPRPADNECPRLINFKLNVQGGRHISDIRVNTLCTFYHDTLLRPFAAQGLLACYLDMTGIIMIEPSI